MTVWTLGALTSCGRYEEKPAPAPVPAPPAAAAAPADATPPPAPPPADTTAAPPPFDFALRLGVGRWSGENRICIEIKNAHLASGDLVLLISPLAHAFPSVARVVAGAGDSCASAGADTAYSHYTLRLVQGQFDEEDIGIVLVAAVTPRIHDGVLSADLDGDGQPETFHACTSAEGVHLTVWTGAPPEGTRRWHRYVHVGAEVRPNCTEPEAAPDPRPVTARPSARGG